MKKKAVSMLLTLTLIIVSLSSIGTMSVSAASNDVTGLESGSTYYIKNLYTGKYLDVYNGQDVTGQNVWTYTFNRTNAQKWRLSRNSDGTYKIYTLVGSSTRVLDITGTNVDIWTDLNLSCQKFSIVRDNTYAYGGTYYIKNGSNYVVCNVSTSDAVISSSGGGLNAMWSFEEVSKGDADIYAFNYWYWEGIIPLYYNSTGANNTFKTQTSNMGYTSYAFNNYSATNPLSYMKFDQIWVHSGHGNVGFMAFRDDDGNWSYIQISDINAMTTNQLSSARAIITTGCYTAETTDSNPVSSSNNIIYAMYAKGAHFALGWTGSVNTATSVNWIKNFFNKSGEGETIKRSIEHADYWSNCGMKFYFGDTYQSLSH